MSPFGRSASALKIHNQTLREIQHRILADAGCQVRSIKRVQEITDFPCVVVHDDVYFSHYAMARFLRVAKRSAGRSGSSNGSDAGNWQAALHQSDLTDRFSLTFQARSRSLADDQPVRVFDCYYLQRLDPAKPLDQQSQPLPIPHRVLKLSSRVNRHFDPDGRFVVPVSLVYLTSVSHWANLIAANLLGMPAFLARLATRRCFATALMPGRMLFRSGSLRPASLAGKFYYTGRRCRVHPSAQVVASVLGDRVTIGPNAIVRNSIIDDRAEIGAGAVVEGCTLGKHVNVDPGTVTRCCVAGDGANLGTLFSQLSVIGSGAVTCPGSGVIDHSGIADFTIDGTVPVQVEGQSVPSGMRLLGGCVGDNAFLGPGVALLCGREIPPGCILVQSPREAVRDVNKRLPSHVIRLDQVTQRTSESHRPDDSREAA